MPTCRDIQAASVPEHIDKIMPVPRWHDMTKTPVKVHKFCVPHSLTQWKKDYVKKINLRKLFGQTKNIFDKKKCYSKNFGQKNSVTKKKFGQKKFLVKKILSGFLGLVAQIEVACKKSAS